MNSKKYFEDFFEKKKDEISFITIKKDAKIKLADKIYLSDKELPLPIRVAGLVNDIQNQDSYDGISIANIVDGIIYTLGTEKDFEYKNDYLKLLKDIGIEIEPYVIHCINKFDEKKTDDAIVYGKCLINTCENCHTAFVYASVLERKSVRCLEKNINETATICMQESVKYFEKALDYDETFALSYYKLGFYYKNMQLYIKAKLYWEKQQKFDDDDMRIDEIRNELEELEMFVQYEEGYTYVLNNEPQKGLDLLLPIAENFSNWWNLLFFIGLAYRTLGEYQIAERYFENVLKIEENHTHTLNELGLCKMCLGKYEQANELFTILLSIDPKNAEILCNRAVGYLYLNDIDKAKADIDKALEINPDDEIALEIKKQIEQR